MYSNESARSPALYSVRHSYLEISESTALSHIEPSALLSASIHCLVLSVGNHSNCALSVGFVYQCEQRHSLANLTTASARAVSLHRLSFATEYVHPPRETPSFPRATISIAECGTMILPACVGSDGWLCSATGRALLRLIIQLAQVSTQSPRVHERCVRNILVEHTTFRAAIERSGNYKNTLTGRQSREH